MYEEILILIRKKTDIFPEQAKTKPRRHWNLN